jgi:hypothetical protein
MKPINLLTISLILAAAWLPACSGSHGAGGGGGGGNQNANLVLTMTSSPSVSLSNISILSAIVDVSGITLNPATGNPVPLPLHPAVYPVDLMRLQSDSAFLGSLSLAAQTYNSASVTFSAPVLTIDNQSGSTINGTCLTNTICQIVLPAGSIQLTAAPFPLTLSATQQKGISFNFNLNNALTLTSNTLALNFAAANVFTTSTLPRAGTASGILDTVEDFVGTVSAVTSTSVTVTSSNGVSLLMSLPSSVTIEDPQALCSALNATCLVANQTVVSVDASVNTDGTLTLLSADLLDIAPREEVEGTLISNGTAGQFFLVVANKVVSTANTTLTAAAPGDIFLVTLANPSFLVDSDEFFNNASFPASAVSALFSSEANLIDGQDVMVHVTAATGSAATHDQALTADQVRLRFTRTSGTVANVSGQSFTLTNFPASIPLQTIAPVDTVTGVTRFDNVSDISAISGNHVSIRALLVRNSTFNFYAVKVRQQP